MINKILIGIINLVIGFVNVILWPLEQVINALVPNLLPALDIVSNLVSTISSFVTWFISYTGLTSTTMSIITSLLYASVMIPLTAHAIKLGLKWYNALKI